MSIDFKQALGTHAHTLALRSERTRVLASNIANESTPGYQARDVDFASTLRSLESGDEAGGLSLDTEDPKYRVPFHPSQDGNTVELGVEQAQFAQNANDFQTSLTFVNMKLRGLAKAIEGR